MTRKIVILGAGNLATHLTRVLIKKGFNICQIYSRTIESARELGLKTGVHYTNNIKDIYNEADIYIYALSDSAISSLAKKIDFKKNPLLIHTAGSVSINVLKNYSNNYAVLYPLQTFSKTREIDFNNIPLCIDANNTKNLNILESIARSISTKVYKMGDEDRLQLHLSAVFASNFTNHMYSLAEDILKKKNIDFNILKPLIEETASKIQDLSPQNAQTGPAARKDKLTMKKHKELLENDSDLKKMYTFISNNIIKSKEKNGIF